MDGFYVLEKERYLPSYRHNYLDTGTITLNRRVDGLN